MTSLLRSLGFLPPRSIQKQESKDSEASNAEIELDINDILPRIYACGRPSDRPTDVSDHRNNIAQLAAHLDKTLGENYLVVNLSNKNRNMIDYGKFHNSVVEFQPFSRSDLADDTPAMGQIFRICYALTFWMSWGPETRLVLHCNTGVFRTGFVLACYMVYTGMCGSVEQGLSMFCEARKISTEILGKMLPSWRYLMREIDRFMSGPPSLPKVWKLNYIIINAPGLAISTDKDFPAVQLFEGPRVVYDSTKDATPHDTIRWEDGKLIVEVGQLICGDYQLWVLTPARQRASASAVPADANDGKSSSSGLIRKHAARFAFHSSMLDEGVNSYSAAEVDIWRANIDKRDFALSLLTSSVPVEDVIESNTDKAVKRSYIGLRGPPAIVKGAEEYSAHVYVFPDAKLLKQLVASEGFDETAAVCALQRSNNNIGKTREYLQAAIIRDHFKEPAALRDLKLLRDTLSMEEVANAFLARGNVGRKKKGVGLDELDVSGLLEAAKVGNLVAGGAGGPGGPGGGGKGKKRKGRKKGKGKDDDSSSESDDSDDSRGNAAESDSEEDEVDGYVGGGGGGPDGSAPKLFANDAGAKDDDDDDEEIIEEDEDEGGGPWLMKEHPIFSAWFKMLADGKSKADVLEVMAKDQFNPALLDQDANSPVPENVPASLTPLKDWEFLQKYFKMLKVGLPRPVCEHKMISENCNPLLLDADENSLVMASDISPPKKKKSNKPQIVRKKLHWVPIRGKIEGTIWAGPPGDLIAAASQLIDNEKEFERLFIQKPEDMKKKKKKDKDNGGVIQLLDGKRAMNAGIALAKLKMSFSGVVECLQRMTCRNGKKVLSLTEVHNLVTLCPTDEEIKLVKGFHGDTGRLAQAEKFMLAVADVPMARQRAEGLLYQAGFDERLKESLARINLFTQAIGQIRSASRLQRFLKAVLVLGNKMNGVTNQNRKQLVKAFTVNSLHQLHLTKAFDQQTSVLQYLIKLLKRKDPDLLKLSKDFKGTTLAEAKRLPLDVMNEEMRELRAGLTALETVVREAAQNGAGWASMTEGGGNGPTYIEEDVDEGKDDKSSPPKDSAAASEDPPAAAGAGEASTTDPPKKKKKIRRRVEPLPEFASIAQNELSKLEEAFNAAQTAYKDLVKFCKEDSEMAADDLFGNLHLFLQTFDSTLNAMIEKKRKEKEAKRRAKEMKHTKKLAARKRAEEAGEEVSSVSSSSSEDEDDQSGDDSSDFDDKKETSGEASWNKGSAAPAQDDDDEEDEPEETAAKPSAADPKAAMLAAIGARKRPEGDGDAAPADPRAGLLSAIKKRGGDDDGDAGSGSSTPADPRAGLLSAIKKRGGSDADDSKESSGGSNASGDPRSALLSAIQSKKSTTPEAKTEAKTEAKSDVKSEGSGEDRKDEKDTGWVLGTTDDKDPEADGRNSMLAAIRAKRKT